MVWNPTPSSIRIGSNEADPEHGMLSRIGIWPHVIRHVCYAGAHCVFSVIAISYPWILNNKSQGTFMILTNYNLLDNIYICGYQTFKLAVFSRRSSQVSSCWTYHPACFTHGMQICSICILGKGYNLCTWVVPWPVRSLMRKGSHWPELGHRAQERWSWQELNLSY